MAENTFRVKKSKIDNLTVDGDATLSGVNVSGDLAVNTDTLFVDSSNNRVGIGTASPDSSYKLDVVGGNIRTQSDIDANDLNLTLGSAITVDQAGGYVGVSNSSPSYTLDVNGDAYFSSFLYSYDLDVANNATISAGYLACSSFYDGGGSSQWGSESGGTFTFNGGVNISDSLSVTNDLTVDSTTLHVDSSNNRVGFGTASPSHPAHFVGSSTTSEYISLFTANGTTPEAGQISSLSSKGVAVQSNGGAYYFGRDPLNNIEFAMGTSSAGAVFSASFTNHDYQIRTNNTNRIHVESSNGNVGIGTTSPDSSFKLDVAGNIRTQSSIDASDANLTLGSAITVDQAGGYVGIGNSSPSYTLDIPFGDINVGGYVYTYDLDVGNNATISMGYLACSSFYDAGGSSQWGSESGGTFTFNGDVNIGGQVEASSQAASTDNSLMTRSLGDARYRKKYAFDYPLETWHNHNINGTTATAVLRTATNNASITNPNSTASDYSRLRPINRAGSIFVRALVYNSANTNRRSMIVDFIPRTTNGSSADTTWMYVGLETSINDLTDTANLWGSNVHGYGCTITNIANSLYAKIAFHANSTAGVQTASTTKNFYAANPQKCYRLVMTEEVQSNNNISYEVELYDLTQTSTASPKVDPIWSESISVTSANKTTGNSALGWYGPVIRSWSDNTDGNTMALSVKELWIQ